MNLAETVAMQTVSNTKSVLRCMKTNRDLGIRASSSEEFFLARIPVNKIALSASTKCEGDAIVLDSNALRIGRTVSGFIPKVMIVKGHNKVTEKKASSILFTDAWLSASAIKKLHIMADDAISSNELQQKIQLLLTKQYPATRTENTCGYGGPWIREIYPFENYVIFDNAGDTYRQPFVLDPVTRVAALSGKPIKVYQEFSDIPKGLSTKEGQHAEQAEHIIQSAAAITVMPSSSNTAMKYYTTTFTQEQTFDSVNDAGKPLGMIPGTGIIDGGVITSLGAPSSEYANPPLKTMMNIEEALNIYLSMIADGTHTPLPSLAARTITAGRYPDAFKEATIAAKEIDASISIPDFFQWQASMLNVENKTKNGLAASAYAYVGDADDISTWQCPINSSKAVKNSLKELSASFVPQSKQAETVDRLRLEARKFSTDKRDKMADKGTAEKDGSYPIANAKDLANAVKDFYRSSGSATDKAHIQQRAKALGVADPFKKDKVKATADSEIVPGGTRPGPVSAGGPGSGKKPTSATKPASNTICKNCGYSYSKHNGVLGMSKSGKVTCPLGHKSTKEFAAAGNPNSGKSKFKLGDKVETKFGKGVISDPAASKEHVEVQHMDGKVKILHKDDVKKVGK